MTDEPLDEFPPDVLAAFRAPVPTDSDRRETHIRAALSRFDALATEAEEPAETATQPPHGATVIDIRSRRRTVRWLGVAAAVLLAVGGVFLANRAGGPVSKETADRAAESLAAAPSSAARSDSAATKARPSPPLAGAADQLATPAAGAAGLGPTSTVTLPAAPFSPAESAKSQARPTTSGSAPTCRAPRLRAALLSISTTTIDGRRVLVYSYVSGPRGAVAITVTVDAATCART